MIADSLATYTPGVSERRGGTTRYNHSGLKNTGAQSTNAIVATRVYDAYGMVRSATGTWSGPFGYRSEAEIPPNREDRDEGNESRLVGRNRDAGGYGYQEDETGLRLLGHRYYDASTGRFLTRDPIKDGRNWYSYCDGDPINGVDPTGLWAEHLLSGDTWREGLITSGAALGSSVTVGIWDGGEYQHRPGFHESRASWTVAQAAGSGAAAVASVPRATLYIVPKSGYIPVLKGSGAVIGQRTVKRVLPVAKRLKFETFTPTGSGRVSGWFENLRWMLSQIFSKDHIVDVGPVPGSRPSGPWYIMERILTRFLCKR